MIHSIESNDLFEKFSVMQNAENNEILDYVQRDSCKIKVCEKVFFS